MFKQIFRITFVALIWRQYKQAIVSTLMLFAFLWLVGSMHSDYLHYAQIQEDESLAGKSFLVKWAAFTGGFFLYILYHWIRGRHPGNSELSSQKSSSRKRQAVPVNNKKNTGEKNGEKDPFSEIRKKKKLRTRAEIMIDKTID